MRTIQVLLVIGLSAFAVHAEPEQACPCGVLPELNFEANREDIVKKLFLDEKTTDYEQVKNLAQNDGKACGSQEIDCDFGNKQGRIVFSVPDNDDYFFIKQKSVSLKDLSIVCKILDRKWWDSLERYDIGGFLCLSESPK